MRILTIRKVGVAADDFISSRRELHERAGVFSESKLGQPFFE